jgi:hypothetical protein
MLKWRNFDLLKKHFSKAKNQIILEANHVFGGSHPYSIELPDTRIG